MVSICLGNLSNIGDIVVTLPINAKFIFISGKQTPHSKTLKFIDKHTYLTPRQGMLAFLCSHFSAIRIYALMLQAPTAMGLWMKRTNSIHFLPKDTLHFQRTFDVNNITI